MFLMYFFIAKLAKMITMKAKLKKESSLYFLILHYIRYPKSY